MNLASIASRSERKQAKEWTVIDGFAGGVVVAGARRSHFVRVAPTPAAAGILFRSSAAFVLAARPTRRPSVPSGRAPAGLDGSLPQLVPRVEAPNLS
jgi:hypothetical protein